MKTRDLIEKLKTLPLDANVVVFTAGEVYPTLDVTMVDDEIEIACGWNPIENE